MRQYLEHAKKILTLGGYKPNRTSVDSISRFGHQVEYELSEGFPLTTTKATPFKAVVRELLWFLSGDTNVRTLIKQNVHIWDRNAFQQYLKNQKQEKKYESYSTEWYKALDEYIDKIAKDEEFARVHGDLGPVYGKQWRRWEFYNKKSGEKKEIDQLQDAIELLQKSPSSRRIIVNAWNPPDVPSMALPPCHTLFHLNVLDGVLDLHMVQRSCDMFLGVPFNIASYALLTHVLAQETGLQPGRFIHTLDDAHFYCGRNERGEFYRDKWKELQKSIIKINRPSDYNSVLEQINSQAPPEREYENCEGERGLDHATGILEQLAREPYPLPKLQIAKKSFDKLTVEDFQLTGYQAYPAIKRQMAV